METEKDMVEGRLEDAAVAVAENVSGIPERELTDLEMGRLADFILEFAQAMCGIDLYPYEVEFGWRVIYSLLIEDSDEITALFSRQSGKCLAKGTPVMMWDGSTKPAEEVEVGDTLMGDNWTPRRVLGLARGREEMWEVRPIADYHDSYVVNESHILSLKKKYLSRTGGPRYVDVPLRDVANLAEPTNSYMGYTVPVEFEHRYAEVDPYWLGLWLGDGCSHDVGITSGDGEVVAFMEKYASSLGLMVSVYKEKGNCSTYAITGGNTGGGNGGVVNPLRKYLQDADLLGNKHIPDDYRYTSSAVRQKLLAGLVDSDGHRGSGGKKNTCEIIQKNKRLASEIQWLARSLGYRASLRKKEVGGAPYWRVSIYGALWEIPTKISRKQYEKGVLREDPNAYGFTLVPKGVGDYYGFRIDGNKRFLLGDFTVTHNTETVAVTVCGLLVILPILGMALQHDERLAKFKDGLWVGIYGPNYEQAGIMWSRTKARMYSNTSKSALLDPDINIDLTEGSENLTLPNGSFVDCGTASPQSSIEGKTYHLIILEECQGISSSKIRSSIHPMAAATAGTLVKIGTCNQKKSDFYAACRRNKRSDVHKGLARQKRRRHFEYDYTTVQRYNPRYRKYVAKEKERLGEDSDDFRMKYRLHWLLERGVFVNPDVFDECGIKDTDSHLVIKTGRGRYIKKVTFTRPPNVVTFDSTTKGLVAAIDVGRENSTIVTVAKPFWDGPVDFGGQTRYPTHLYNWLELYGDNHEKQHPEILSFLKNYSIDQVIIDATGKGDPVYSRMEAELEKFDIEVVPFIFSASSKDIGYKVFSQEIATGRFTFPAGARASRLQKWQRFVNQMYDLEKSWRGSTMVVKKPAEKEARDDYPDSAMMICWLVNLAEDMEMEVAANPFLGRAAQWANAHMMQETKAWYQKAAGPKTSRQTRPSRRGAWD